LCFGRRLTACWVLALAMASFPAAAPAASGAPHTVQAPTTVAALRIGLLDPGSPADGSLTSGATIAVAEINASGGIGGRRLQLVVLEPASPWRDTGSLLARAIFDNGLSALVGPTEGAAAHVAAQVGTKIRIPVVTLSAEDSLTEAGDPWIFRGIPGDGQQARALLSWALGDTEGGNAAIVIPPGREGRTRLAALRKACRALGVRVVAVAEESTAGLGIVAGSSSLGEADVLFLWLDPEAALRFLRRRPKVGADTQILGNLWLAQPDFLREAPSWADGLALPLLAAGQDQSLRGALGYDMVMVLAAAARGAGSEPAAIREGLLQQSSWDGKTGNFRFGPSGERSGKVEVGVLRDGRPVRASPDEPKGENGVPGTS